MNTIETLQKDIKAATNKGDWDLVLTLSQQLKDEKERIEGIENFRKDNSETLKAHAEKLTNASSADEVADIVSQLSAIFHVKSARVRNDFYILDGKLFYGIEGGVSQQVLNRKRHGDKIRIVKEEGLFAGPAPLAKSDDEKIQVMLEDLPIKD